MVNNVFFNKMIVRIEDLYAYINSPTWEQWRFLIEAQASNVGKKSNYKKFAKRMKKAIKYLPEGLEVIVRAERDKQ